MKYDIDIVIEKPLKEVVELFTNPDHIKDWQTGFESLEHLSGEEGLTGAKSKLNYNMGKRKIEMIETIEKNELPKMFIAIYEAKGVWNRIENEFLAIDQNKTQWKTKNEFKFSGFMKLMGFLMPKAFKKQSRMYLEQFKAFAESHNPKI